MERALRSIDRAHDNAFPFAEIMFAMVLNRLVDPVSKRACNQWVRDDAWLPELPDTEVHHFYRALDLLQAHKDDVLAAIARAAREGLPDDFRMLKTPLKLRPMHHRASRRIEAHMLMCGLALMLAREPERRTGETLETLRRVFGTVRAVEIQQGPTRFWQREEWTEDAQRLVRAAGAPEGPRTWAARRCEA